MHIAISAPSIIRENKKAAYGTEECRKSATKRLVNIGWSMKPLRIFLNITIRQLRKCLVRMFKKWLPDLISA